MKPPPPSPLASTRGRSAARLLAWFDRHQRDLPWRRTRDPYRIWVSEVMLQQTRVEVVIPYYERFLARFESLESLAGASQEEVLAAWSGLGYYRRARLLHAAAVELSAEGRSLPRTAAELRRLPGFGPYTAAAVASIAFGEPEPALDGNVIRVISRRVTEEGSAKRSDVRRRLERQAAALLDAERPGDSNQALMELGATICRPRRPRCEACPLRRGCAAAAAGTMEAYPRRTMARKALRVERAVVVVEREGRLLLFRRAHHRKVLGGTWELPFADGCESEGEIEAALSDRYGGCWDLGPVVGQVRHTITHRSFRVGVRRGRREEANELREGPEAGWFRRPELENLPHSAMVGKALDSLEP